MLDWLQSNLIFVISASILLILIAILSVFKRSDRPEVDLDEDEEKADSSAGEIPLRPQTPKPAKTTSAQEEKQNVPKSRGNRKEEEPGDIAVEILEGMDIMEEGRAGAEEDTVLNIPLNNQDPEELDLSISNEIDLQLPVDLDMQLVDESEPEILPEANKEKSPVPPLGKEGGGTESRSDKEKDFQLPDALDLEWPVESEQEEGQKE